MVRLQVTSLPSWAGGAGGAGGAGLGIVVGVGLAGLGIVVVAGVGGEAALGIVVLAGVGGGAGLGVVVGQFQKFKHIAKMCFSDVKPLFYMAELKKNTPFVIT